MSDEKSPGSRKIYGPKPWKTKRAPGATSSQPTVVEIFETKPPIINYGLRATPSDKYIRIGCQGDGQFVVPVEVVKSFEAVETVFEKDGVFKECLENYISFPDITQEVLEAVIRYAFNEYINKLRDVSMFGTNSARTVFQFEVDPGMAMELISAAHYLGQHGLLSLCTTMVARHIADVPDLSTLPLQLAQCIAEQLTPQDLLVADERPDFQGLGLDTEPIWKAHCLKLGENIHSTPETQQGERQGLHPSAPSSWKAAYVSHMLQKLADRQTGETNEAFLAELSRWGKYAVDHTIYLPLWEGVVRPMGPGSLVSYVATMGNLTSLCLHPGLSLNEGPPGEETCLCLGEVLHALPRLRVLYANDIGVTAEAASRLGASLAKHSSLQVLRLGENNIGSQGLAEILRALPHARSLKVLDVSDNGILSTIPEDAIAALAGSALEELLYDGFQDTSLLRNAWSSRLERSRLPPGALATWSGLVVPLLSRFPPSLRRLSMRSRELTESQIRILLGALADHTAIEVLELDDNQITGRAADAIFTWLQKNASLKVLRLDQNKVDDSCVGSLMAALMENPSLLKLSLFGNTWFGEERVLEVVQAAIIHSEVVSAQMAGQTFEFDLRGAGVRDGAKRMMKSQAEGSSLTLLV